MQSVMDTRAIASSFEISAQSTRGMINEAVPSTVGFLVGRIVLLNSRAYNLTRAISPK